jgi:hypothetical protein
MLEISYINTINTEDLITFFDTGIHSSTRILDSFHMTCVDFDAIPEFTSRTSQHESPSTRWIIRGSFPQATLIDVDDFRQ